MGELTLKVIISIYKIKTDCNSILTSLLAYLGKMKYFKIFFQKYAFAAYEYLTIVKELQIRRGVKLFGKWSRSSGRQARHPIDRARAEREQFEPSEWLITRGKS